MSNRLARRVLEQLETAIPPEWPAGLDLQALEAPAIEAGEAKPEAPEVSRSTASTYDSRPLASREFHYASAAAQQDVGLEQLTVWNSAEFVVPAGRIAVVRLASYFVDPLPGSKGIRADNWQFSLLRNGDLVPDHSALIVPPWGDPIATHLIANEGDRLAMRLTYINLIVGGPTTTVFVNFKLSGQLLLATGEPFEQLVASAPPPAPRPPAAPPPPPAAPQPAFRKFAAYPDTRNASPISVAEQMQRLNTQRFFGRRR